MNWQQEFNNCSSKEGIFQKIKELSSHLDNSRQSQDIKLQVNFWDKNQKSKEAAFKNTNRIVKIIESAILQYQLQKDSKMDLSKEAAKIQQAQKELEYLQEAGAISNLYFDDERVIFTHNNQDYKVHGYPEAMNYIEKQLFVALPESLTIKREIKYQLEKNDILSTNELVTEIFDNTNTFLNSDGEYTIAEAVSESILEYKPTNEQKYTLILNDTEPEIATKQRIIEYAKNRLEANPEDKNDWSFDTKNLTFENAIDIIASYGEDVKPYINQEKYPFAYAAIGKFIDHSIDQGQIDEIVNEQWQKTGNGSNIYEQLSSIMLDYEYSYEYNLEDINNQVKDIIQDDPNCTISTVDIIKEAKEVTNQSQQLAM